MCTIKIGVSIFADLLIYLALVPRIKVTGFWLPCNFVNAGGGAGGWGDKTTDPARFINSQALLEFPNLRMEIVNIYGKFIPFQLHT